MGTATRRRSVFATLRGASSRGLRAGGVKAARQDRRGPRTGPVRWLDAASLGALLLLSSPPALAYIDPGTGSALVYVVTGIIVSIYFAVRGLYYKGLELFFRVRFKAQKCTLAIHSEDPRYETTFLPVLKALADRGVESTFFTMYERGGSFEPLPPRTTHVAIPQGLVGYSYLNHLEAELLVTTTPQVDVMMFRRSKGVKHYCIVQHALGESRYVRPFAYDFFDSVLCCGPLLAENIRRIESIRNLPPKRLLETGVPHYDELVRLAAAIPPAVRPTTVLVAPSWGPCSLFTNFGTGFVRDIARRFPVVVRPHPQMRVSQAALYEEICAMEGVTVDTEPTPSRAMASADVLLSDISGIVYEYSFLYRKPALVVDLDVGVGGLEGHLLRDVPSMKQLCADFIEVIPPADVSRLPERIEQALDRSSPERIAQARDEFVFNYGRAGAVAAGQIEEILACR